MKSMREFFLSLGLAALAYFSPLYEMFVVLMLFVAADLVTGILASKKTQHPPHLAAAAQERRQTCELHPRTGAGIRCRTGFRRGMVRGSSRYWSVHLRGRNALHTENMAVITAHPVFLAIVKWFRGKAAAKDDLVREIINEKNDLPDGGAPGAARDAGRMRGEAADDGIERKTDNRQRSHS